MYETKQNANLYNFFIKNIFILHILNIILNYIVNYIVLYSKLYSKYKNIFNLKSIYISRNRYKIYIIIFMDKKDFNPYNILGVNRDDSLSLIKKKYYKMAMRYHPDKYKAKNDQDKKVNETRFKNISKAYSILSDDRKRYIYDNYRIIAETQEDIDDIDSSFLFNGSSINNTMNTMNIDINDPEYFVQTEDMIIGEIMNIMDNNHNFMNDFFRYEIQDSKRDDNYKNTVNDLSSSLSSSTTDSSDNSYNEINNRYNNRGNNRDNNYSKKRGNNNGYKKYICRANLEDIYMMKIKYIYIKRKIDNDTYEKIKLYIDTSQRKSIYHDEKVIVKVIDRPDDYMNMRRLNECDIIFDYEIDLIDAYKEITIRFKHLDNEIYKIHFGKLVKKSQTKRIFRLLKGKGFPKKIYKNDKYNKSNNSDIERGDLYINFIIKLPKKL